VGRPSLAGCWEKLARAEQQLDALDEELRDYVESKPYDVLPQADKKDGAFVFRFGRVPEPPLRFGVIVGEVVHDMRSSLDHLVRQLFRREKTIPPDNSQFPICEIKAATSRRGDTRHAWSRDAPRFLRGLSAGMCALIQGFQPYRRGNRARSDALFILNAMWNIDKHRIIHAAFLQRPKELPTNVFLDAGGYAEVGISIEVADGRVKSGADALRVSIVRAPWGVPKEVDVGGDYPIAVCFGRRRIRTRGLRKIGWYISQKVLAAFAPYFPGPTRSLPFYELPPETPWPAQKFSTALPSDTRKRFGDGVKVWFSPGEWRLAPSGPLDETPPAWHVVRPSGIEVELPATGLSLDDLRGRFEEFLERDVVEELWAYFEPIARVVRDRIILSPK
jgi:hypothetical protein